MSSKEKLKCRKVVKQLYNTTSQVQTEMLRNMLIHVILFLSKIMTKMMMMNWLKVLQSDDPARGTWRHSTRCNGITKWISGARCKTNCDNRSRIEFQNQDAKNKRNVFDEFVVNITKCHWSTLHNLNRNVKNHFWPKYCISPLKTFSYTNSELEKPKVLLLAPTCVAEIKIDGRTI